MNKRISNDRLIFQAFGEQTEKDQDNLMEAAVHMMVSTTLTVEEAMEVLYKVGRVIYTKEVK